MRRFWFCQEWSLSVPLWWLGRVSLALLGLWVAAAGGVGSALAQEWITEDTTQTGGSVTTPTAGDSLPGVVVVSHPENDPRLLLTQGAWREATAALIGGPGESGRLWLESGSLLSPDLWPSAELLGMIGDRPLYSQSLAIGRWDRWPSGGTAGSGSGGCHAQARYCDFVSRHRSFGPD